MPVLSTRPSVDPELFSAGHTGRGEAGGRARGRWGWEGPAATLPPWRGRPRRPGCEWARTTSGTDTYRKSRSCSPRTGSCQGRSRRAPEGDLQGEIEVPSALETERGQKPRRREKKDSRETRRGHGSSKE